MPHIVRFQPNWHEQHNKLELATKQGKTWTASVPAQVKSLISRTYYPSQDQPHIGPPTFTFFPKLPPELRRMIWRHFLPGTRLVELFRNENTGVYRSSCQIPYALSVSKESRDIALNSYELCFGTAQEPPRIYFDMDVDELYLGIGNLEIPEDGLLQSQLLVHHLNPPDYSRLQYLHLDDGLFSSVQNMSQAMASVFPEIRIFSVIKGEPYVDEDIVFVRVNTHPTVLDAWSFDLEGGVGYWIDPGEEEEPWEAEVEGATNEAATGAGPPVLMRVVTRNRLNREQSWTPRLEFFESTFLHPNGCFYMKDGVVEKIFDMIDTDAFDELAILMKASLPDTLRYALRLGLLNIDPEMVSLSTVACVCPCGHKKKDPWLRETYPQLFPVIEKMDLEDLIAILDPSDSEAEGE